MFFTASQYSKLQCYISMSWCNNISNTIKTYLRQFQHYWFSRPPNRLQTMWVLASPPQVSYLYRGPQSLEGGRSNTALVLRAPKFLTVYYWNSISFWTIVERYMYTLLSLEYMIMFSGYTWWLKMNLKPLFWIHQAHQQLYDGDSIHKLRMTEMLSQFVTRWV